jgi:stress response protein YsnF
MSTKQADPAADETIVVPVIEERLQVGIRSVDTGRGVRIHKSVVDQPVEIDERLLRDEVEVKHVPVDRIVALDQAPTTRYEGTTLVVPIFEEVLVVERRLRIKEELHITKNRREERHAETVMLKTERVSVERFDDNGTPPAE